MCLNPKISTMDINDATLLEFAANDDAESFKLYIENDPSAIDQPCQWYCRKKGSNLLMTDLRTPLMVTATYGSLSVLKLVLAVSTRGVNYSCGEAGTTALHCAASGGSPDAVEAVRVLLSAGADVGVVDADGDRPADVINVSPGCVDVKIVLESLLGKRSLRVSTSSESSSPLMSSSVDEDRGSLSPSSDSTLSPMARKEGSERKEYPIDPSLPDIKNSVYVTDEFRMFSFKVRPCSRAYSHDWTECPFVHPGENARRRDPRKFHYSCVPCPDFRKGACRRGDLCEYAHGVFESWLHPAQYRTRLCKDGVACDRRVCFFAHTAEELRPLYVSTGSGVPSPRASVSAMEMNAVMMSMLPQSPSSMSQSMFTPPMSPTGAMSSLGRPPNMPTLHLPGSNNIQSSRLRSSLSARDMPVNNLNLLPDFGVLSPVRLNRMSLNPSNLDELLSNEYYSPKQTTNNSTFSPLDPRNPLLQALSSPGRMSPRNIDPRSPLSQQEKIQQMRSLSSRDLSSPKSSWPKWGSPSGKPDWGVNDDELGKFKQSTGPTGDEPDVSWVHSLVNPSESNGSLNPKAPSDEHAVLGAWLEQLQLDQPVA